MVLVIGVMLSVIIPSYMNPVAIELRVQHHSVPTECTVLSKKLSSWQEGNDHTYLASIEVSYMVESTNFKSNLCATKFCYFSTSRTKEQEFMNSYKVSSVVRCYYYSGDPRLVYLSTGWDPGNKGWWIAWIVLVSVASCVFVGGIIGAVVIGLRHGREVWMYARSLTPTKAVCIFYHVQKKKEFKDIIDACCKHGDIECFSRTSSYKVFRVVFSKPEYAADFVSNFGKHNCLLAANVYYSPHDTQITLKRKEIMQLNVTRKIVQLPRAKRRR